MKQIGDILKSILEKNTFESAQKHHRLYAEWDTIVKEAFTGKRNISKIDIYKDNVISDEYKESLNAQKAADHSAVKYIKNDTLYIEVDHPGWIQILQTKQHIVLGLVTRYFSELRISGLAFVLKDMQNSSLKETAKTPSFLNQEEPENKEIKPDSSVEEVLAGIQDEEFRELLRELGKKTQKSNFKNTARAF